MATITFDTHKFIKDLESAGIPELHAEAIARAQQESLQTAFEYRDLFTSLTYGHNIQLDFPMLACSQHKRTT